MPKVNVSIDMDDFYESWNGETLTQAIKEALSDEIMKAVKKDPRYKEFIQKKTKETISKLEM